jgi:DNA-binding transcriptional regulator YdaS (Cro superfamily)
MARQRALWDRLVALDREHEQRLLDLAGKDVPAIAELAARIQDMSAQFDALVADRRVSMSRKMVSIQKAADFLGVSPQTLRRWEGEGTLLPDERTAGGRRRDDRARLRPDQFHAPETARRTISYARVSSHDQKDDLERQKQVRELYCAGRAGCSRGSPILVPA